MDPPGLDKYLSSSSSRLSSNNAPIASTVRGRGESERRLNYPWSQSQKEQNKTFRHHRLLCLILSVAPFLCVQLYSLCKLTNGKNATERIAYQLGTTSGDAVPEISPLDHFVPLPLPAEVPDWIPPNFHEWNSTNSTPPSVWFDALDHMATEDMLPTLHCSENQCYSGTRIILVLPIGIDCKDINRIC
eukprot:scaffold32299_cov171-Skeletonema_menzelii.AAC.4